MLTHGHADGYHCRSSRRIVEIGGETRNVPLQKQPDTQHPIERWNDRDEQELIDALLRGDEYAFVWLVRRHQAAMKRVAHSLVHSQALADEVVQECWTAVIEGLKNFRGQSTLKTWIYSILINRAKRVFGKERRSVPLSSFLKEDDERNQPDITNLFDDKGHWNSPVRPAAFPDPENQALYRQYMRIVAAELDKLPESQRLVVTLRDVEGLSSTEVAELLEISEVNQRVILHRGRVRLRQALERAERKLLPGTERER